MKAVFDHADDIAANSKTLWFRTERPLHFVPGEFTELYLPHPNPDARGDRRWFTISSTPGNSLISITTKFPPTRERTSTFKQALRTLQPGHTVHLAEPMGDFVMPKLRNIPLLFVAGGIGITPVYSMVQRLQATGERRDITLVYAAATADELLFRALFTTYPLRFVPVIGRPTPGLVEAELHNAPQSLIYLSGPEAMTKALTGHLIADGIDKRRIITDFFPGYPDF